MIKDLAFVVALAEAESRKSVAKRIKERLNPLGQRHVSVVVAPVGGIEMFQQLQGDLAPWWADHVFGDEVYVCLDHEAGLREWTAAGNESGPRFLIRVGGPDQAVEYADQECVETVEEAADAAFADFAMAMAPLLDPRDDLSGAFIGVDPIASHDSTEPSPRPSPPAEATSEARENAEPKDAPEAKSDAAPESLPPQFLDDEPPWPTAPDEEVEDPSPVVLMGPEDDPALEPLAAPTVGGVSREPDLEAVAMLDREPHVDISDDHDEAEDLEDRISLLAEPDWDTEDAPVFGEVEATDSDLSLPETASPQVPTGAPGDFVDTNFFESYQAPADREPSAPPSGVLPAAGEPTRPVDPLRAHQSLDGEAILGGDDEKTTPHPFVLYAKHSRRSTGVNDSAVGAVASPKHPSAPLHLPSYGGPSSLPPPVAAVWSDDEDLEDPVGDPVASVSDATLEIVPEPDEPDEIPDQDKGEPAPGQFGDTFSLEIDEPLDPWGFVGDSEQPTAASPFALSPTSVSSPSRQARPVAAVPAQSRKLARVERVDSSPGKVSALFGRLRPRASGLGALPGLFGGHSGAGQQRAAKRRYEDDELAGFMENGYGGVVVVGALKGGVGKTATSNVIADIAGKMLSANNASAAWVDANLNNPDAAGFFREELRHSSVTVQSVIAALTTGDAIPEPLKATAESVALYPESKGVEEYTRSQIKQFQSYCRVEHRLTVVDLANVLPALGGGPAAKASLHWLEFADVVVVPTDLNPTSSLPDAYEYIQTIVEMFGSPDSLTGKPVLVIYIVPADKKVLAHAKVQEGLAALESLGAKLFPVPYRAQVMLAGATHQSLDSLDKELSLSYRALTEAVIVAFASTERLLS